MNDAPYSPRGLDYVAGGNFIAVNRSILRAVGINAALLLGELADKARYLQSHGELDDGWFYMRVEDVERNTTLGEKAQRSAIETLRECGAIEVARRGMPRKRWFRIDAMRVIDIADGASISDVHPQSLRSAVTAERSNCGAQCQVPAERSGYYKYTLNKTDNKTEECPEGRRDRFDDDIDAVIDHLNEASGKSFRRETKVTRSKVRTLLKAGYTQEDITRVIDLKCSEWLDNPRMREYVRPKTLFAQENFESYHNQLGTTKDRDRNAEYVKYAG